MNTDEYINLFDELDSDEQTKNFINKDKRRQRFPDRPIEHQICRMALGTGVDREYSLRRLIARHRVRERRCDDNRDRSGAGSAERDRRHC